MRLYQGNNYMNFGANLHNYILHNPTPAERREAFEAFQNKAISSPDISNFYHRISELTREIIKDGRNNYWGFKK